MTSQATLLLLSAAAAALWLGAIVLLHVVKPELDPKTRMVSEYACGPGGWIMRLAFFSMAASNWLLAAAIGARAPPAGPILLILCGLGFAGAGVFTTDPMLPGEKLQTRAGALHVLFAFAVIGLFPIMATVVSLGLAVTASQSIRSWLPALAVLTWAGGLSFVGAAVYSARRRDLPLGYAERVLVLTYTVWQIAVSVGLLQSG